MKRCTDAVMSERILRKYTIFRPRSVENNTALEEVLVDGIISVDRVSDEMLYENPAAEDPDFEVVSNQAKLKESSPPSFLPHVTMLPDSFPSTPLYYNQEDLSRLDGTNCHEFVKRMKEQIHSDWIQISAILRAYLASDDRNTTCSRCDDDEDDGCLCRVFWDPDEDLEWYKWSLCNIYSRSTDFLISDGQNQRHKRVIVPIFDMINHDFTSDVYHAMDQEGNVSVFNGSMETIHAGSEIFLNYGNFPNEKLLSIYGFVVEKNPFDAVQIYAPIRPSDPLYEAKARVLLSKCAISDVTAPHLLHLGSNPIIPHTLLSVLRIVGIQSLEEIRAVGQQGDSGFVGMINCENEQSALSALGHALHTMARRIALSMISDDNLNAAAYFVFPPARSSGIDHEAFSSNQPITLNQAERAESTNEKNLNGDTNLRNATILCRSDYCILQAALNDISDRLEKIQIPDLMSSIESIID